MTNGGALLLDGVNRVTSLSGHLGQSRIFSQLLTHYNFTSLRTLLLISLTILVYRAATFQETFINGLECWRVSGPV